MPLDAATVSDFARRYLKPTNEKEAEALRVEQKIEAMVPQVREVGFLTREEFLIACRWKTPRIFPRVESNRAAFVEEATRVALAAETEEMRIGALRLLSGVEYSVASVFLHWFHREPYPILDVRAAASLGSPLPVRDDLAYWTAYVERWREARIEAGTPDARTFDRALWQWDKAHGK